MSEREPYKSGSSDERWDQGLDQTIHGLLHRQARGRAGRSEEAATTGRDAAKMVPGRGHGLAVNVMGLVIGLHPALPPEVPGTAYLRRGVCRR
ncbi:hypothetical protein [Streptomyces sp. NBC_01483]|uniref:hypothetical protein n=1 Tax=Streptomyces sp. NBC_01483 TaxID=2903883 RepID=UPI002E32E3C3|nr:hypothetical protein [Streptomyces sp. NBC_01483]